MWLKITPELGSKFPGLRALTLQVEDIEVLRKSAALEAFKECTKGVSVNKAARVAKAQDNFREARLNKAAFEEVKRQMQRSSG